MKWDSDNVDPRLLELICDLQDGCLSEEDGKLLNDWLKRDPQARQVYHAMMDLHLQLDQSYSGKALVSAMPDPVRLAESDARPEVPQLRSRSLWWAVIATAFVMGLLLSAWAFRNAQPETAGQSVVDPFAESVIDEINGVAVLTHAIAVQWDKTMPNAFREGDTLPRGVLRLAEGLAQIEFFGGATVILEGPAEFELLGPDRAKIAAGKLQAFVPEPAQGFTIEAPDFNAVDLGTEFAISLDAAGRSEIHVVDGEVSLRQKNGDIIQNLPGGRAVQTTDRSGQFKELANSQTNFVDREEISRIALQSKRSAAESWSLLRDRWASDPDTVVYFDFENQEPWDRRLNSAKPGSPEGAIVGAQWTQGRWPSKGALAFRSVNDRVRLDVPGEFDSLTFAVHIRLDGLFQPLNSLFMADEFDSHEPHWQIRRDGVIKFGISQVGVANTKPILNSQDVARWIHLVVVYDQDENRVSHYLDGELVSWTSLKTKQPLRIRGAELGNWQTAEESFPIRRLSGTIDEFLIVSRALSEDEIRQLASGGASEPVRPTE